jgi:hypothetical protein
MEYIPFKEAGSRAAGEEMLRFASNSTAHYRVYNRQLLDSTLRNIFTAPGIRVAVLQLC